MTTSQIEQVFNGTAERYADPNCEMCEGMGLVGVPVGDGSDQELCLCVRAGRNEANGEMLNEIQND